MEFSLSTAWNADKTQNGRQIAEEISNLGLKNLELNFSLSEKTVEEIFQFCTEKGLTVTSLHNYCPYPKELKREIALPDCFSLSSADENERKKAVEYTKITLATAKKFSAQAVVLHSGRVEMEDKTRKLIALYNDGKSKNSIFLDMREDFVQERKKKSSDYFNQILKSLNELSALAVKTDIMLGIENRFYYREIPSIDEFAVIFHKFNAKNVGYWHDVGHAFIHEQLGLMNEGGLLQNYGKFLIGFHLHNVKNLDDHQAPASGDFDFYKLKSFVKPDTIKVIEAHSKASPQDVKDSVKFLEEVFRA
jgi:sugar phosphate isomerase/epimerase